MSDPELAQDILANILTAIERIGWDGRLIYCIPPISQSNHTEVLQFFHTMLH
jgi:hypothetical protein